MSGTGLDCADMGGAALLTRLQQQHQEEEEQDTGMRKVTDQHHWGNDCSIRKKPKKLNEDFREDVGRAP